MRKGNEGSKFMLFLMVWAIFFIFVLMFSLGFLSALVDFDLDEALALVSSPLGTIVYQLLVFILPLTVWIALRGESFKPNFPAAKLGGKNILILVILSFLLQPVMMMISGISGLFFNNDVAELMYTFQRHPFWLQLLAIAVTPAICEELVFRGYIQSKYRNHTIRKVALINGLFFAMMHLNLQQFAYTFVLGIVFAYLVHHTRSIWAAILPHFIVNGTQVALSRMVFAFAPEYVDTYAEELLANMPVSPEVQGIITFGVISLILSPVIFILYKGFVRHNKWRFASENSHETVPAQPVGAYDYGHNDESQANINAMPEWARSYHETHSNIPNEAPEDTNTFAPQPPVPIQAYELHHKPSRIDPFAIGVVVVFIVFVLFLHLGS